VRFIKRFPEVEFITATQAAKLYRDKALGRAFSTTELKNVAAAVSDNITFQKHDDYALSASDVFALLNAYVVERAAGRKPAKVTLKGTPFGPSNPVPVLKGPVTTDWSQFSRTAVDVADYLQKQGRIPTSAWLGSVAVPPEAYLRTLADVALTMLDGKEPAE